LTKIDLIEDKQWLDLVKEEMKEILKNSSLANAPFVSVSALTGEGLEELKIKLAEVLSKSNERPDLGRPRMSIDRVFTISGFGTVVTGTLVDGVLRVGEEIEVLPNKLKGRIRGLQTHKKKVEIVVPGSRTAINITGIDVASLKRGDVVTHPGIFSTSTMIDVQYRHLVGNDATLKHDQQVKLFIGATQTMARVRVLGLDQIKPGEEGWLQLVLEEPIVAVRGDHYILRRPSPGATLGGGRIANPKPARRHRLKDLGIIQDLEKMLQGTPGEVLAQSLLHLGPVNIDLAIEHTGMSIDDAKEAIQELQEKGDLIQFEPGDPTPGSGIWVSHPNVWQRMIDEIMSIVSEFHQSKPLKFGILKEELKSRSKLDGSVFSLLLKELHKQGLVIEIGVKIAIADYVPDLNEEQERAVKKLMQAFLQAPYSPPSIKTCIAEVGEDLYLYMIESGRLVKVSEDVVFEKDTYVRMIETIRKELLDQETLSVAEVRDMFNTSRKFALAFMEHLDSINITRREGDIRRLVAG
jgi:selenocysteine-specific elongation factor